LIWIKGSEVGQKVVAEKEAWMADQGIGGYPGGWLHNRRKSAIKGWAVPSWHGISGKG